MMAEKGARPYYVPVADEERVFKAAARQGLSILLKGPTGCGKTRFVEAMAYDLERPLTRFVFISVRVRGSPGSGFAVQGSRFQG